jgi:hypothetical protein
MCLFLPLWIVLRSMSWIRMGINRVGEMYYQIRLATGAEIGIVNKTAGSKWGNYSTQGEQELRSLRNTQDRGLVPGDLTEKGYEIDDKERARKGTTLLSPQAPGTWYKCGRCDVQTTNRAGLTQHHQAHALPPGMEVQSTYSPRGTSEDLEVIDRDIDKWETAVRAAGEETGRPKLVTWAADLLTIQDRLDALQPEPSPRLLAKQQQIKNRAEALMSSLTTRTAQQTPREMTGRGGPPPAWGIALSIGILIVFVSTTLWIGIGSGHTVDLGSPSFHPARLGPT